MMKSEYTYPQGNVPADYDKEQEFGICDDCQEPGVVLKYQGWLCVKCADKHLKGKNR